MRIARIAGIDIVVAPSWFLSVILIVFLATPVVMQLVPEITSVGAAAVSVILAVLLAVSVLAHELGHCLAARLFRIPVREVRLYLIGGVSELGRSPSSPAEEALVAGAGPAVSILLTGICWLLTDLAAWRSVGWLILLELAVANGVVAAFNLLPALPLDGGRVARAAIWRLTRRRRLGTIVGVVGGLIVAAALIVWAAMLLRLGTRPGLLQAAIVVVMAAFVAAGAWAERPPPADRQWPPGMTLSTIARHVVEMGTDQPIAAAVALPPDFVAVVMGPHGRTLGVVNVAPQVPNAGPPFAGGGPDPWAASSASSASVTPLVPEMIVLAGDEPEGVVERVFAMRLPFIVLMGDDGRATGVVMHADIARACAAGRRG